MASPSKVMMREKAAAETTRTEVYVFESPALLIIRTDRSGYKVRLVLQHGPLVKIAVSSLAKWAAWRPVRYTAWSIVVGIGDGTHLGFRTQTPPGISYTYLTSTNAACGSLLGLIRNSPTADAVWPVFPRFYTQTPPLVIEHQRGHTFSLNFRSLDKLAKEVKAATTTGRAAVDARNFDLGDDQCVILGAAVKARVHRKAKELWEKEWKECRVAKRTMGTYV
ncbi:hypothetical protein N7456_012550 [Penicillium angulare]|uniref:Uncharacterized protein n=1 Tax=Penicillium angulare TaxID=116970 RepID=A0A9W9EJV8_9EURO|nr:hypothetical protein N7456_012550 [Penicillium angulare]